MSPYYRVGSPDHCPEPMCLERRPGCSVCAWLICFSLLVVVILGFTALALYFVFRPQAPQFSLSHVDISDLNIGPQQTSPSSPSSFASSPAASSMISAASNTTGNNPTLGGVALPPLPGSLPSNLDPSAVQSALTNATGSNLTAGGASVSPSAVNSSTNSIMSLLRGNAGAASASNVSVASLMSGFLLNSTINFTIDAKNPNKVTINYRSINITLSYRSVHVGDSQIPTFEQGPGNATSVPAAFLISNFPLDSSTAPKMLADFEANSLPLTVGLSVEGSLSILGVATPFVQVGVSCDIMVQPSTGSVPSKTCMVTGVQIH